MRSLLPPVNISDANESNQANRMSINQYHLGRRMNSVPGEEYFSCIVLRRTGIGPFDFGWWGLIVLEQLPEAWKSSRKARPVLSSATLQTRALLIYLSWKTGRTFALAPPLRERELARQSSRAGRVPHSNRIGRSRSSASVPRFHAPPQTNQIYQLTPFLSFSTSVQLSSSQTQRPRNLHLVPKV